MKSDKDAPIKSEFHFTTARQHYVNRRSSIERLSTGSRNIDDILCGGIETKAVTELRSFGTAKTKSLFDTPHYFVKSVCSCNKIIFI